MEGPDHARPHPLHAAQLQGEATVWRPGHAGQTLPLILPRHPPSPTPPLGHCRSCDKTWLWEGFH